MKSSLMVKVFGGAITVGLPILYMVAKHLSWEPKGAQRVQMGFRQLGFWGGSVTSVIWLHKLYKNQVTGLWIKSALLGLIPIVGYELTTYLAPRLFPEKSKSASIDIPQQAFWKPIDANTYPQSSQPRGLQYSVSPQQPVRWSIPATTPSQQLTRAYNLSYNAILNMPPVRSPYGYLMVPGAKMRMGQSLSVSL